MKTLLLVMSIGLGAVLMIGAAHNTNTARSDKVANICDKALSDAAPGGEKRAIRQICDDARKNIK